MNATTEENIPSAPNNVRAVDIASTSVTLRWFAPTVSHNTCSFVSSYGDKAHILNDLQSSVNFELQNSYNI